MPTSPWRFVRPFVVAVTATITLAFTLPDIALPWHPFGTLGFDASVDGRITSVYPNSPAAAAGMKAGDQVDMAKTTAHVRRTLGPFAEAWPGVTVTYPLIEPGGTTREVTLIAEPLARTLPDNLTDILEIIAQTAFILIAVSLVLLRPSLLTWAFYWYALGNAGQSVIPQEAIPDAFIGVYWLYFNVVLSLGTAGFVIFALLFPRTEAVGWRRPALVAIMIGAVPLLAINLAQTITILINGPAGLATSAAVFALWVAYSVGVCLFIASYVSATPAERPRIRWVLLGFIVGFGGMQIFQGIYFLPSISLHLPIWLENTLQSVNVFVPLAVAYAIFRHRVIDVRFVAGRALVYGATIVVLAGCAGLVQVTISDRFRSTGLGGLIAVLLAVAVGAFMLPLSRWAGGVIERRVFARQTRARDELLRLAHGLPYAESGATIARVLTEHVCRCLDLTSAAVFWRQIDGTFAQQASAGWSPEDSLSVSAAENLCLAFEGSPEVFRLPALAEPGMPHGNAHPILGFPLFVRRQLAGFALYSAHENTTDLDPDELALLSTTISAASRGYDALELAARVEAANEQRIREGAEHVASLQRLSDAQARFVPREFLHYLGHDSIVDVALGEGVERTMTVLFSDIRSFTTLSEGMTPPAIFAFLNEYMKRVGPLVREHNGFIDKYIGDAVMGLFPVRADDALLAAIALQKELRLFNRQLAREGKPAIAAGVGMHTGELMIGTIGERGRMETTVIADAVNAASRLESATKTFGCSIVLSRATKDALEEPDRFTLRRLGMLHVKGKAQELEVFECCDGDPAEIIERKLATADRFAMALTAVEAGDFGRAYAEFASIGAAIGDDGPTRYYAALCSEAEKSAAPIS